MATESEQLDTDTRVQIVTPENIAFHYRIAGPFRRLPAYLIDLAIRLFSLIVLLIVLSLVFGSMNLWGFGVGIFLMVQFGVDWFYGGVFEAMWNGQTPGKRLMRMRVLTTEGNPINGWQAILRNFLRAADSQPFFFYQVGLFASLMNARLQRLGDLAAGTIVVVEDRPHSYGVLRVTEPEAVRLAGLIPTNFQASRSLARALSTYVQRRQSFSWGRRAEIARHVGEPLRERFELPAGTSHDMLLCAAYYRIFIADRADEAVNPYQPTMRARPMPAGALPQTIAPSPQMAETIPVLRTRP